MPSSNKRDPRKRPDEGRPAVRSTMAKVTEEAARPLRAGHPWVFRDGLLRDLDHVEAGTMIVVADAEGQRLGSGIVEGEGAIAIRMVSRAPHFQWSEDEIRHRVEIALRRREHHLGQGAEASHRIIHGDADGFPGLAIDRLGDFLLLYKYARAAEVYLDALIPVVAELTGAEGIYLQDRVRAVAADDRRPPAFHMHGKKAPVDYQVEEDGLKFVVDVTAPVSPGLFLDLREGRRLVETRVRGKRVLNLFSYTGAIALRAVRGGAAEVVNVDAAARSHARCRQNLAASGLDPEACDVLTGDVFKHLEKFRQRDRVFDFIIVDPPPFSTVGSTVFSAMRDWADLIAATCPVVAPGGEVLVVCNAAGLREEEFLQSLGEGCGRARRPLRLIAEVGLPPDFPVIPAFAEGKYLKIKLLGD